MSLKKTGLLGKSVSRWVLLTAAVTSMMLVGLYQYSWSLFVQPISQQIGQPVPVVQLTFVIFTWVMTLTQPLAGIFADRKGPRYLNLLGALLAGMGWILSSRVNSTESLFLTYGLGGVGVGIFYATSVGTANKWFPDKRGLATGLASFGYGFGAAVFNPIISYLITALNIQSALFQLGLLLFAVLLITGFLISYPRSDWTAQNVNLNRSVPTSAAKPSYQYGTREMVSTRQWWQIYLAFILTANLGLMVTPQLGPLGASFNLDATLLVIASSMWPFANGLGRILGGWVSDKLGRERTMALYFTIQGFLTLSLQLFGFHSFSFVLIVSLLGLIWGPIFAFFPSISADYYGRKNSTANYGLTYTAKGWGALLGGFVLAVLATAYGGYALPLIVSAIFSFTAAVLVSPKLLHRPVSS
jgi:OFA family oxalate/formate antiporter-like MFS transporter